MTEEDEELGLNITATCRSPPAPLRSAGGEATEVGSGFEAAFEAASVDAVVRRARRSPCTTRRRSTRALADDAVSNEESAPEPLCISVPKESGKMLEGQEEEEVRQKDARRRLAEGPRPAPSSSSPSPPSATGTADFYTRPRPRARRIQRSPARHARTAGGRRTIDGDDAPQPIAGTTRPPEASRPSAAPGRRGDRHRRRRLAPHLRGPRSAAPTQGFEGRDGETPSKQEVDGVRTGMHAGHPHRRNFRTAAAGTRSYMVELYR